MPFNRRATYVGSGTSTVAKTSPSAIEGAYATSRFVRPARASPAGFTTSKPFKGREAGGKVHDTRPDSSSYDVTVMPSETMRLRPDTAGISGVARFQRLSNWPCPSLGIPIIGESSLRLHGGGAPAAQRRG